MSDDVVGPEEFGQWYDANAESILGYFYRRTASPDIAADLTAETFATALGSLDRYEHSKGTPRQWLYGIARHQMSRYLRRRRIDTRARERLGMRPVVDLDTESRERIEDLVDLRKTMERLAGAMDGLSSKLARAVTLRVLDELPYSEVARELGISEPAARARVYRGLIELAEAMEDES